MDMSFSEGILRGPSLCAGKNTLKVFDWVKAAQILKDMKPEYAEAGLKGDWNYTGGCIWNGDIVTEAYTYLASMWAKPCLRIDDKDIECYIEHPIDKQFKWNANTKWPEEAREIIRDNPNENS